jgi:hypothetical protein
MAYYRRVIFLLPKRKRRYRKGRQIDLSIPSAKICEISGKIFLDFSPLPLSFFLICFTAGGIFFYRNGREGFARGAKDFDLPWFWRKPEFYLYIFSAKNQNRFVLLFPGLRSLPGENKIF